MTGYRVYRTDQTFSGPWATVSGTTFTNVAGITSGAQYCYEVSATNSVGSSSRTSPVCVLG